MVMVCGSGFFFSSDCTGLRRRIEDPSGGMRTIANIVILQMMIGALGVSLLACLEIAIRGQWSITDAETEA